jgi:hypothetical protein
MNTTTNAPLKVELNRAGRLYGMPALNLETRVRQEPPPEIGKIFVEDLVKKSAIMALPHEPTRGQILAAYKSDIALLTTRRNEADGFMKAVLETAIPKTGSYEDFDLKKKEWKMLQGLLRPLGITPQISFTAERAALPANELTVWLKSEFKAELDRIARRVATTLQYLADHNVVGLIEFPSTDVCKFHYFTWASDEKQVAVTDGDKTVSRGMISFERTVTNEASLIRTRHTHHLVDAAIHRVADYKRPIPGRVKELLERAPAWLKENLLLIDGTETLTEEVTDVAGKLTTNTVSVVRYDPAVAFGQFALAGCSESETQPEATVEETFWETGRGVLLIAVSFIAAAVIGISILIHISNVNLEKDHQAYVEKNTMAAMGKQFNTKTGERLTLPIQYPLVYNGVVNGTGFSISLKTIDAGNPANDMWSQFGQLNHFGDNVPYGDVDLTKLNVPLIMHVLRADPDSITYTVEQVPGIPEGLRHAAH